MNTVTVSASRKYDILIGSGLMNQLGSLAHKLGKAQTICLVSESTVFPLYGEIAADSLKAPDSRLLPLYFQPERKARMPRPIWRF